ncbi:hypothetical protein G7K_2766-t1 [Saitoella complicata NRRL Y-17804]|uniref:Nuclear segregation protein Bfr1 n=2 Tax=Saitoella complicata (strain BCRC 22490 / CBS 7301 / JCM 7358 / NBRC 10748 / NRRL Y-17804) TaxID=698492 RepID=A0A0E9NFH6_SAICN|nr:hypothetical protein G7K_2766-t1 [Saitoella complicata NRRL Y-17804]
MEHTVFTVTWEKLSGAPFEVFRLPRLRFEHGSPSMLRCLRFHADTLRQPPNRRCAQSSKTPNNQFTKKTIATAMSVEATTPAVEATASPSTLTRPTKPDDAAFIAARTEIEKEIAAIEAQLKPVQAQISSLGKNGAGGERNKELKAQLDEIKTKQAAGKSEKGKIHERARILDDQIKKKIADLQAAKKKAPSTNPAEITARIADLEAAVESGSMKLVEEKKALAEISNLKKARRNAEGFEAQQAEIDALREEQRSIRASLDDPESRALSAQYDTIRAEMDKLRLESDVAYKSRNATYETRNALKTTLDEAYAKKRALQDEFYTNKNAYKIYEAEERQKRFDRQRAEREKEQAERRREAAAAHMEEASHPAFEVEIIQAENLLKYFDPSFVATSDSSASLKPNSTGKLAAREVTQATAPQGTILRRKDDDEVLFAPKKGKAARNNRTPAPAASKFNIDLGTMNSLSKLNIQPPMSAEDQPRVVEELKKKVTWWKENQERVTKENVEKARKEVERLEKEANAAEEVKA